MWVITVEGFLERMFVFIWKQFWKNYKNCPFGILVVLGIIGHLGSMFVLLGLNNDGWSASQIPQALLFFLTVLLGTGFIFGFLFRLYKDDETRYEIPESLESENKRLEKENAELKKLKNQSLI
ncbi:hypothetical protein ACFLY7_02120 [Patescibacteria group bacterium]